MEVQNCGFNEQSATFTSSETDKKQSEQRAPKLPISDGRDRSHCHHGIADRVNDGYVDDCFELANVAIGKNSA